MKKLKKKICLFLSISMLLCMNNISAFATEEQNLDPVKSSTDNVTPDEPSGFDENAHGRVTKEGYCGGEYDAQYKLYEDGTLYIYGVRRNIVSCADLKSDKIEYVYIEDGVSNTGSFSGFLSLKGIRIPNSSKSIGSFSGCVNLEEIEIPNDIKIIESGTFSGCSNLRTVEMKNNVEKIGNSAFKNCERLETINISDRITSIGKECFYGCICLTDFKIGNNVNYIGEKCFFKCESLKSIVIPENVEKIEEKAFSNCISMETVEICGNTDIEDDYYLPELRNSDDLFAGCKNLKTVVLHEGFSSCTRGTFYGCVNLELVEIPSTVTHMSVNTFYACEKLTIRCLEGSYAETFATENDIPVDLIHIHKYESSITKEPTCVEAGIRTYTCSCGDEYKEEIPEIGHNYNEETTRNPTCTENGIKTYVCTNCNNSYTEEIPATGHDIVIDHSIEPTETEEGKTEGSHCRVCGEVLKAQEIIPATGKPTEPDNPTIPDVEIKNTFNGCKGSPVKLSITCKENDAFTFECLDNCGMQSKYTGYSSIISGGFSSYSKSYELVFDSAGEHIISAYKNGNLMEYDKVIIAEEHIWDSGKVDKKETCTQDGRIKYTCTNCENTKTESIPATGHNYSKTVTRNATCTSNGIEKYTCSKCRNSYNKTIPKTGHKYGKWKVSKKPTIFKKGAEKKICTICGKTLQTRDIKKLKATVKISKTKLKLKKGKTYQLKIKKKSKGDKMSKWTTSNKKVVSVNKKTGKIKALKKGKAKITVKMKSGCKATCKVTVK